MRRINLALIAGIFLASISLWFSATGLVHLFSGAGIGIILMAIGFEMAKISGVTWLIRNGKKNLLSVGLVAATLLLTTVSSLGIYGYLGRAYASGRSSDVATSTEVATLSGSIAALSSDRDRAYALIASVPANQGTNRLRIQKQTQPQIDRIEAKLAVLRDSLAAAKSRQATVSNDIGDLRFAADLFSTTQEKLARLIVTVLAFLLDPLAVMLVLASGVKGKREEVEAPVEAPFVMRDYTYVPEVGSHAQLGEDQIVEEPASPPIFATMGRVKKKSPPEPQLSPALSKVIQRRQRR